MNQKDLTANPTAHTLVSIGRKVQGAVITSSLQDRNDLARPGTAQFMRKERGRESMDGVSTANVIEIINDVCAELCDKYCKWPEKWDAEKEGMELCESDICGNCPMMRLQ